MTIFSRQPGTRHINRLLTGILMLLLLAVAPAIVRGEGFSEAGFQTFCKRIFRAAPLVKAIKGEFRRQSIEGTQENTQLFAFEPPYLGLEYRTVSGAQMADYDVVTISGREFGPEQAMIQAGAPPWPNLPGEGLKMSELAFKGRRFLVVSGGGSGLFQSGSYQQVTFFHLFELTRTKKTRYYRVASRFGSPGSFGDYNGDGRLDFVHLASGPDEHGVYEFGILSIDPSGVSPLRSRSGLVVRIRACMVGDGEWIILRSHLK